MITMVVWTVVAVDGGLLIAACIEWVGDWLVRVLDRRDGRRERGSVSAPREVQR